MRAALALALLLLAVPPAWAAAPCSTCQAAGGTYEAVAPPGWNGRTKLRLLLFLHGWMMTGADITEDEGIRQAAAKYGFLLVAPDGLMRSWAHTGSPSQARDDVDFLRKVVADVERRWPIDRRSVVAAGFSQGGSMVWDLACYAAKDFTAFLPFSGAFWEPLPRTCPGGPVSLRHVHGLDDHTVPMAGRALFGPYRQGSVTQGFAVWVAEDRCARPPATRRDGALNCEVWAGCGSGRRLELCTRPGGHRLWAPDIEGGLRWVLAR
jgi:polyhydroxybutyrate depolymerase